MEENQVLVSAKNLTKTFKVKNGYVKAVGGVDLDIIKGNAGSCGRVRLRQIDAWKTAAASDRAHIGGSDL